MLGPGASICGNKDINGLGPRSNRERVPTLLSTCQVSFLLYISLQAALEFRVTIFSLLGTPCTVMDL
jgi:hypothetical protein